MDAVFYLTFYEHHIIWPNEHPSCHSVGFYISNIKRPWMDLESNLVRLGCNFSEEYGVHNWQSSPVGVNVLGYNSYEVEDAKQKELLDAWRRAFARESPNCVVGPVCAFPDTEGVTDAQIVQFIQEMRAQHQALTLHAVVNADPARSSASKKM